MKRIYIVVLFTSLFFNGLMSQAQVKKGEKNILSSIVTSNKYQFTEVVVIVSTFDYEISGDVYAIKAGERIAIESNKSEPYKYLHEILNDMLNGDNAYELIDRRSFIKPNSTNLLVNHLILRREKKGFDE